MNRRPLKSGWVSLMGDAAIPTIALLISVAACLLALRRFPARLTACMTGMEWN